MNIKIRKKCRKAIFKQGHGIECGWGWWHVSIVCDSKIGAVKRLLRWVMKSLRRWNGSGGKRKGRSSVQAPQRLNSFFDRPHASRRGRYSEQPRPHTLAWPLKLIIIVKTYQLVWTITHSGVFWANVTLFAHVETEMNTPQFSHFTAWRVTTS